MKKRALALDLPTFYEMLQQDGARAEFSLNGRYAFTRVPGKGDALWVIEADCALLLAEGGEAEKMAKTYWKKPSKR